MSGVIGFGLGIDVWHSAIMKYHGLKMEEVNDTMRHLWNKTYQGTGEPWEFRHVRLGR